MLLTDKEGTQRVPSQFVEKPGCAIQRAIGFLDKLKSPLPKR